MLSDLVDRSCKPCRAGTPPLRPEEFQPLLRQLHGWQAEDGKKIAKSDSAHTEAKFAVDASFP
jgi:hypothetical protein